MMECIYCGKDWSEGPNDFAYLEFGAERSKRPRKSTLDEDTVGRVRSQFGVCLRLGWHGSDTKGSSEYAEVHPSVEFDEKHPQLPTGELQGEFLFCSTDCLRDWFSAAVDVLEELRSKLVRGEKDGVAHNPVLSKWSG